MTTNIKLVYDPSEDGGWDTFALGEEFETPLMFEFDELEFSSECSLELTEVSLGRFRIGAKILNNYEDEFLFGGVLRFNVSKYGTPDEEIPKNAICAFGIGSFHGSPLWRPQWPDEFDEQCTYRLRVTELRKIDKLQWWEQRDASAATIVQSMGDGDNDEAWFLISCEIVSGPIA